MTARFGLQELIGLAPLPESDALDACGPPVFADDWPQADNQGEGDQPPAYDVERVATALDQASREADSYLAVRLAVPLDTTAGVPQPLRAFVCDMARYHLTAGFGMQVPEDVEARYKAALAWLKDVAKGRRRSSCPRRRTLRSRSPRKRAWSSRPDAMTVSSSRKEPPCTPLPPSKAP